MGWLIALGILILLGLIPLGIDFRYQESGLSLKVKAAGILLPIDLLDLPKKEKKPKKQQEKPRPEDQPQNPNAPRKQEKKTDLKALLPLIRLGLQMLGDLRRKLRVDHLELQLMLAGGDPCDLAIQYGNTWAAVGNLMGQLENALVIRHRDIDIQCDFTAEKTRAAARLDLHLTLGRMLGLAAVYGVKALRLMLNAKKGGA